MTRHIPYFAYGTRQRGFTSHAGMIDVLGEPRGRFRTVAPLCLVVPREPGCANQAGGLLHRTATLGPDLGPLGAQGDL